MAWIDKIRDAIADTATLDVVTTTGSIKLTAADMDGVNWEQMADTVSAKIKAAEVDVVAFTHSQWDCDSFVFVKNNLSDAEKVLVDAHGASVQAAHETRREAVKMLADIISP